MTSATRNPLHFAQNRPRYFMAFVDLCFFLRKNPFHMYVVSEKCALCVHKKSEKISSSTLALPCQISREKVGIGADYTYVTCLIKVRTAVVLRRSRILSSFECNFKK